MDQDPHQCRPIQVSYKYRSGAFDDWQDADYPIRLEWTPCHYGGQRPWFNCPRCGRRVAVLYGAAMFLCRHCYGGVSYSCQRENAADRAARRAEKIRDRLRWEPGILNLEGRKPKGMHRRTFERLKAQHDADTDFAFMGWNQQAEKFLAAGLNIARF